jgi:colicin import membrane protein
MTTDLIIPEPLRAKARELALPDSLAGDLLAAYAPFAIAGGEIKTRIAATDTVTPALARDFRLAMVKVRTASDKKRKELKSDSLLRGKAIDGLHAMIELEASAVERSMDEIEKAAERAEAARIAKLREDRLAALRPYVTDPSAYAVEKMTDAAFAELVESSRLAYEARERARIEAEAKCQAELEARRKAEEDAAMARLEKAKTEAAAKAKREAEEAAAKVAAAAEAKALAEKQAAAKALDDAITLAAKREVDARYAAEMAEAERKEERERAARAAADQAKRIAQMEAAAARAAEDRELLKAMAEARAAAAKQKQEDDRAAVIKRIAADLAQLKKDGKIGSMTALAECIVAGGLRGVMVDWEAA